MIEPEAREVWPGDGLSDWDCVDEASWESFPASDPPAFHVLRVGPPAPRQDLRTRRARRRRRTTADQERAVDR